MDKTEPRKYWYISPLTSRILGINIAALLILAVGVLYTGQYERQLIKAEQKSLLEKGELYAAAIAESGVRIGIKDKAALADDLSRLIIRKLGEGGDVRIMLFNKTGILIADSHQLLGAGGLIQMVELDPPIQTLPWKEQLYSYIDEALSLLPTRIRLPEYPRTLRGHVQEYPNAIETLAGEKHSAIWRDEEGEILLTASIPVQRLKHVIGAVLLTKDGKSIDQAVRLVQITVLKLFFVSLLITVLLSIYLSETIGRPIMRLARAAETIQQGLGKHNAIPDLTYRKDEIGVLSQSLKDMTIALSDRLDAIEHFAADVAHEIKNPLASVNSAIETLDKIKDPEKQKTLLLIIQDDVKRMTRLINDVSAASRLDSELLRGSREKVDLRNILITLVDEQREKIGSAVEIDLDIPDDKRLFVRVNEGQIYQVVQNLLNNALSFSPPNKSIRIDASSNVDATVIHVENEGVKIPEDKLESIFERFYSERPKLEQFGTHSGLGLSISRQIIKAHQGLIYAQNMKDKNGKHKAVRFTVVLPTSVSSI